MRPGELIQFLFLCFIVLMIFLICLWIFRKKLRIPLVTGVVLTVGLVIYYISFPSLQERQHIKDYATLQAYLTENYPDINYIATPDTLEEGAYVGEFYVTREEVPEYGIVVHVKGDDIVQTGWYSPTYPLTKDTLWHNFYHFQDASFEKPIKKVTPMDRYEDGALQIVAVSIDGIPSIGAFEYSSAAIKTLDIVNGTKGQPVTVNVKGNDYTYIPEDYSSELADGFSKGIINF